ncbi:MAG: hypothetical protein U0W24_01080 [Bacteroidales bacterium]
MKLTTINLVFCLIIALNINSEAQSKQSIPQLQLKWSTEKSFLTPESVLYNPKDEIFYVSNVNGNPVEKDGNGFISKLSRDGKIVQLKWINGLNAPKGLAIFKDKLYISDIDELVEVDINTGKILKKYPGQKATFLNDIVADSKGNIYVSDTKQNLIYWLKKDKFEIWLYVGNLFNPNGLTINDKALLVGCEDYILSVDLNNKHVRTFITETGPVDGLVKISNNQFLISDWTGNIHLVSKDSAKLKLLSATNENLNAADFEFVSADNLLLVPTFSDNRVIAYELKM